MNILVTGANGQLGNEMRILAGSRRLPQPDGFAMTILELQPKSCGHCESTADDSSVIAKSTSDSPVIARSDSDVAISADHNWIFTDVVEQEGVDTTILDITDLEAVRSIVREHNINVIVNCAAYTNVDAAESNFELAELLNAKAPENLAIAMKEVDGLLVHVSTDYVFGGDPYNTPCREDQTGTPTGVYGLTKLHGEQNIIATGCRHVIIRTAWLYSEFGKNFVKTMLRLTAEKPSLKVVFDQVGTPTYALDLARAILCIIAGLSRLPQACGLRNDDNTPLDGSGLSLRSVQNESVSSRHCETEGRGNLKSPFSQQADDETDSYSCIYHYSNEGVCSWYDFTKMIAEYSGHEGCDIQPCHSDEFPSPVKRPAFSVLDKTKIKETFGVEVPYWTDSLKVCLKNMGEMK